MRVTVDTNILINAFQKFSRLHQGVLSLIEATEAVICLDIGQMITHEYRKELSGVEQFEKWYQEMFTCFDSRYKGRLPSKHVKKLTKCGCHEDSDHVFIAVAWESGRILLTEDSDMGKGPKGQIPPHDQALAYLESVLNLTVHDAQEALSMLSHQLAKPKN